MDSAPKAQESNGKQWIARRRRRKAMDSNWIAMDKRKNPIKVNEGFKCVKCKMDVKPHPEGGCRNHCPYCLYSMHVDLNTPGDRLSECQGLMKPVGVQLHKKKGTRIIHICQKCGLKTFTRAAPDDDWNLICQLSRIPQG